ncbi:MAG: radical SAM protein, partial [Candidatus Thorarchaeota archaeon]
KQADLFTYGSKEMGEEEFPKPNPEIIEELFSKIRTVTPEINVLHIDNVNPGTVARHPEESKQVAQSIIKYHTAGDVAAFGVESLDPEVIKRNNLKATAEEILSAIRILNDVGSSRNDFGLPHLLPGLNLLYGLPGETKKTVDYNMEFLQDLVSEGLIVRRINIRQVIGFEGTRLSGAARSKMKHHQFFKHKEKVRDQIDRVMIKRVAPAGTIIRSAYLELQKGNSYLLRQLGTYPLLCHMPMGKVAPSIADVVVIDHGPRSLTVLPYPFLPTEASLSQWKAIPGIGAKRAARLKGMKHPQSIEVIESSIETNLPEWLKRAFRFVE